MKDEEMIRDKEEWLDEIDSIVELQDQDEKTPSFTRQDEIELVHRLDKRLLLFAMFGNLVKALDNSNLGSAFISGMEEELHITGIQYNWMGVMFMLGYLSMQLPSNILLSNMRPSKYLPTLELIWCVLTISMSCVKTVKGVYFLRFLLGLAEAGFYPGIVFLVGTWYTKKELGKRLALMGICGSFGNGLSGIVQAIMLKTMDGVFGLSGWRWMFLFDASITLALAILGYRYLPDYPHNTVWLNEFEKKIAVERVSLAEKKSLTNTTRFQKMKLLCKNKFLYLFIISWATLHIAMGASHVLGIVSKKIGFDSVTSNLLTTPDTIITMIVGLCNGFISDRYRNRVWCIIIPACVGLLGMSLLALFVQPFPFLYIAFLLTHSGLGSTSSIIMTWASETISTNTEVRAMAIAIMNTSSSIMWIWAPLVLWPVTDAPYYHKGFTTSCFLIVIFLCAMYAVHYILKQDAYIKRASSDDFTHQQDVLPLLQEEDEKHII